MTPGENTIRSIKTDSGMLHDASAHKHTRVSRWTLTHRHSRLQVSHTYQHTHTHTHTDRHTHTHIYTNTHAHVRHIHINTHTHTHTQRHTHTHTYTHTHTHTHTDKSLTGLLEGNFSPPHLLHRRSTTLSLAPPQRVAISNV